MRDSPQHPFEAICIQFLMTRYSNEKLNKFCKKLFLVIFEFSISDHLGTNRRLNGI